MKKFNIKRWLFAITVVITLGVFSSCESKLEDEFYDPEKITDPNFEMLFAGALQPTELFRLEYGPNYHFIRNLNRLLGVGYFNGESSGLNSRADNSYPVYTGWSGGQLRNIMFNKTYVDFYKNIPFMTLLYNGMTAEEKENYMIYFSCLNVVKAYMFQKLTDIYDDVPFTEAGGALQNKFLAKYDSQQSIYYTLLDSLKSVSSRLRGYTLNNSLQHQNFKVYDLLNNGDVVKWEKFANSLRLRMAIRLSVVDPAKSKEIINEIVSNNLPLVTEEADFIGMSEKDLGKVMELYWPRAFAEMFYNLHAPHFLVNDVFGYAGASTPANQVDPRLYVMFQPNIKGKYIGIKPWGPEQSAQLIEVAEGDQKLYNEVIKPWNYDENTEPYFSMYNKVTYLNYDAKYPAFTPSETHLLLAEAAIRFPEVTGGINPVDHYKLAISQSINWYYQRNNENKYSITSSPSIPTAIMEGSKRSKPDQASIDAFLTYKSGLFTGLTKDGKIKEIFNQKFAHFNIFNLWEIWSEARRLEKDYGIIVPKSSKVIWMERFQYPENEPAANAENYSKVAAQDNITTPVWWSGRK
jgi:hypothetical protein